MHEHESVFDFSIHPAATRQRIQCTAPPPRLHFKTRNKSRMFLSCIDAAQNVERETWNYEIGVILKLKRAIEFETSDQGFSNCSSLEKNSSQSPSPLRFIRWSVVSIKTARDGVAQHDTHNELDDTWWVEDFLSTLFPSTERRVPCVASSGGRLVVYQIPAISRPKTDFIWIEAEIISFSPYETQLK